MTQCNGQSPIDTYAPPRCPTNNCGTCYQVTNAGGLEGAKAGGTGQSIIVQIIDSCPSTNAWNFCKTDVGPEQRCGADGVNHMDIDQSAYSALTGTGGVSFFSLFFPSLISIESCEMEKRNELTRAQGANLAIGISPVDCP